MKQKKVSQNGRLLVAVHLMLWVLMMTLSYNSLRQLGTPEWALSRSLVTLLGISVVFYGNALIGINLLFEKRRYAIWFGFILLLILSMTTVRVSVVPYFAPEIMDEIVNSKEKWAFGTGLLLYSLTVILSSFYQLLLNRYQELAEREKLQAQRVKAELDSLRARLNPHFLFNSLHNIYSLSVTGSEKAPDAILKLSELLRYVTYQGVSEKVDLEQEIKLIQDYTDLFKLRSLPAPDVSFSIEGNPRGISVEPLLALPLVENAFKHGNLDAEGNFARFKLNIQDDRWVFTAVNTFDPEDEQKDAVGGVGLSNIRKRLELIYRTDTALRTTTDGHIFTAILEVPLKSPGHLRQEAESLQEDSQSDPGFKPSVT